MMFEDVGFKNIRIEKKQKYGLGNLISWLYDQAPRGDIKYEFISETLDEVYKQQMAEMGNGEYLAVYAVK